MPPIPPQIEMPERDGEQRTVREPSPSAPSGLKAEPIKSERDLALWVMGIVEGVGAANIAPEIITKITDKIKTLGSSVSGNLGTNILIAFVEQHSSPGEAIAEAVQSCLQASAGNHKHKPAPVLHHKPGYRNRTDSNDGGPGF